MKNLKYKLLLLACFILPGKGISQTFLNGSFEDNNGNNCYINIPNHYFDSIMNNVRGIGQEPWLEILFDDSCHGYTYAQDGNYVISLETNTGFFASSAISMELSDSLNAGSRYSFSYYDRTSFFQGDSIEIGLSQDSNTFGTLIYTSPLVTLPSWTRRIIDFTAPLPGKYITARAKVDPGGRWVLLDNFSFDTTTVSTNEIADIENELNVFPNPSKEIFYLKLKNEEQIKSNSVKDILGREVFHSKRNLNQINLSEQPRGIYFLQAETANGKVYFVKLMKE